MPEILINVVVGLTTTVVSGSSVWAWQKIRGIRALNRKAAFFGLQQPTRLDHQRTARSIKDDDRPDEGLRKFTQGIGRTHGPVRHKSFDGSNS